MSSAAPGASYLFPRFDYGAGELYQATLPTQVLAAGFPQVIAVKANHMGALRIASIQAFLRGNAAAGTRTLTLRVQDGSGLDIYNAEGPVGVTAITVRGFNFQTNVTSAFSTGGISFTPLVDLVIPPGWQYMLQVNDAQAGDTLESISSIGTVYPAVASTEIFVPTVAHPLLT